MWLNITIRVAYYFVDVEAKPHNGEENGKHAGCQVIMVGFTPVISFNCNAENNDGDDDTQYYKIADAFGQKESKQQIDYTGYYN